MEIELLSRELHAMSERFTALEEMLRGGSQGSGELASAEAKTAMSPLSLEGAYGLFFQEVSGGLEALRVAEEELRQQNEMLREAREVLEAERERYRDLFEFAPDGYLVTDADGVVREANHAAVEMLGLAHHFLLEKPLAVFVPEGQQRVFQRWLAQAVHEAQQIRANHSVATTSVWHWDGLLRPRSGAPFHAAMRVAPMYDPRTATLNGLRWSVRDVSERARREAEVQAVNADLDRRVQERTERLEQAQEYQGKLLAILDALLRGAPAPMALLDPDLRFVRVNGAMAQMYGISPGTFRGWTPWELFGDSGPLREGQLRAVWEAEEPIIEQELSGKDPLHTGETGHWRLSVYPVRVGPEEPLLGLGVVVTIETGRKLAEQERARASEEREALLAQLDAVLNQLPAGVLLAEAPSGRILRYNHQAEVIWHGPLTQPDVFSAYRTFQGYHPDGRLYRPEEWPMARVITRGETTTDEEIRVVCANGAEGWISVSTVPIRARDGRIIAGVAMFRDITREREEQEHQARELERERHIAFTLQAALLEHPRPDAFPGLLVETFYEAALAEAKVGGDFFDVFRVSDGKITFMVGDVSGKGLQAAARTAEIKHALRAFLRADPDPDPGRALERLNNFACDADRFDVRTGEGPAVGPGGFISLCLVVLDPRTGTGAAAVAGAEPPLFIRHPESRAVDNVDVSGETDSLDVLSGLILGVQPGVVYPTAPLQLAPGDTMILVTDGVTEARRPGGPLLGIEGAMQLAYEAEDGGKRCTLREAGSAVLEGARRFAGGALPDDVCLLLVCRTE